METNPHVPTLKILLDAMEAATAEGNASACRQLASEIAREIHQASAWEDHQSAAGGDVTDPATAKKLHSRSDTAIRAAQARNLL